MAPRGPRGATAQPALHSVRRFHRQFLEVARASCNACFLARPMGEPRLWGDRSGIRSLGWFGGHRRLGWRHGRRRRGCGRFGRRTDGRWQALCLEPGLLCHGVVRLRAGATHRVHISHRGGHLQAAPGNLSQERRGLPWRLRMQRGLVLRRLRCSSSRLEHDVGQPLVRAGGRRWRDVRPRVLQGNDGVLRGPRLRACGVDELRRPVGPERVLLSTEVRRHRGRGVWSRSVLRLPLRARVWGFRRDRGVHAGPDRVR